MSLFHLREWWSTKVAGSGQAAETTDNQLCHLSSCVAHLLPDGSRDQLVIGGATGTLSVYDPGRSISNDYDDENNDCNYRAEHLLLETKLDMSIIQVCTGKFISNLDTDAIAVLHERKLVIFAFKAKESEQVEHGSNYGLQKAYEHVLQRTAYNMVHGSFGGAAGHDYMCVQSLDGTLAFYENETYTFSRFLPGALLPGPLAYVPESDSFVTVSSSWTVESYLYQTLATANDSQSREEATNMQSGKRVTADWTFELGEFAVDLCVVEISPAQPSILILGERNLVCLTEGGTMRFMKKLNVNAVALLAYSTTSEGEIQFMIASDANTLMVFADTQLKWTVKLPFLACELKCMNLSQIHRSFVGALGVDGSLTIGFLGTNPALYGLPQTDSRQVDYSERHKELRRLQAAIRGSTNTDLKVSSSKKNSDLSISCKVPQNVDEISVAFDTRLPDDQVPSVTVRFDPSDSPTVSTRLILTPAQPNTLKNVQVFVHATSPVVAHQNSFSFAAIDTETELPVTFFVRYLSTPSSLTVYCRVTYATNLASHSQRLLRATFDLPLGLVAHAVDNGDPTQIAAYKLTVESSLPTVPVTDIFQEFKLNANAPTVATFSAVNDSSCVGVVLVSKNAQKYRVQSDRFEWLLILMSELVSRLYRTSSTPVTLSYSGSMPLQEYFDLIDRHFEVHKRMIKLDSVLSDRCNQLRAVQRQLLSRFKNVTTQPLVHLDGLLEMTHTQVMNVATAVQELQEHLDARKAALSAATRLLLMLLQLQTHAKPKEHEQLVAAFSPIVDEYHEQTWEQRVDASITYMLQILSKGHSASSPAGAQLPKMSDASRLKRHVQLLCEKLAKGAAVPETQQIQRPGTAAPINRRSTSNLLAAGSPALETIVEDTSTTDANTNQLGDLSLPEGSKFVTESTFNTSQTSFKDAALPTATTTTAPPTSTPTTKPSHFHSEPNNNQSIMNGNNDVPDLDEMNVANIQGRA